MSVPHNWQEIVEVARLVPECVQQRIDEQLVVLVSQACREIAEVVRLVPRARVQRIDEQIVEVPSPSVMRDFVEEFNMVPQVNIRKGSVNRSC